MIRNSKLSESAGIVCVFPPGTPSSAAPIYVSMKHAKRCTFLIIAAKDSTGSTCAVGINQATAIAGTGAKALNTFAVEGNVDTSTGTLGGAITTVASGDLLSAVTVSNGSFTIPTTASKNAVYAVTVLAKDLDIANNFDCIQLTLGNSAHETIAVFAILDNLDYEDTNPPSVIVD